MHYFRKKKEKKISTSVDIYTRRGSKIDRNAIILDDLILDLADKLHHQKNSIKTLDFRKLKKSTS